VWTRIWAWLERQWLAIRVFSTFFGIIFLVFLFTDYEPLARHVNIGEWMAVFATWASGHLLSVLAPLLGMSLVIEGTRISLGGFAVDVTEACSGVVPTALYWAAVLAYPARWRARLVGLALGTAVIHGLNVLRVIGLILVGIFANPYFHYTHVYFAQALIIVVAVATWIYWANRFADAPAA
jgi:exosortase/archaeosortase family protein